MFIRLLSPFAKKTLGSFGVLEGAMGGEAGVLERECFKQRDIFFFFGEIRFHFIYCSVALRTILILKI